MGGKITKVSNFAPPPRQNQGQTWRHPSSEILTTLANFSVSFALSSNFVIGWGVYLQPPSSASRNLFSRSGNRQAEDHRSRVAVRDLLGSPRWRLLLPFTRRLLTQIEMSYHDSRDSGPIPPRWLHCPRKSATLFVNKFIAFKTPLDGKFDGQVSMENRFPPSMLFDSLKSYKVLLCLLIFFMEM